MRLIGAFISAILVRGEMTLQIEESLARHFPTAKPMPDMEYAAFDVMKSLGANGVNTLLAESSCPDELNHNNFGSDLFDMMGNRFGEVFHLGGLAGVPFTGAAGFNAFNHHVPKDGNIFVVYAPHVGITEQGVVGKVHRPGQDHATSACGASVGAYNFLKKDNNEAPVPDKFGHDFQEEFIISELSSRMETISAELDSNSVQAKLAHETFDIVKQVL